MGKLISIVFLVFVAGFIVLLLTPLDLKLYSTNFECPLPNSFDNSSQPAKVIRLKDLQQERKAWQAASLQNKCTGYDKVTVVL